MISILSLNHATDTVIINAMIKANPPIFIKLSFLVYLYKNCEGFNTNIKPTIIRNNDTNKIIELIYVSGFIYLRIEL